MHQPCCFISFDHVLYDAERACLRPDVLQLLTQRRQARCCRMFLLTETAASLERAQQLGIAALFEQCFHGFDPRCTVAVLQFLAIRLEIARGDILLFTRMDDGDDADEDSALIRALAEMHMTAVLCVSSIGLDCNAWDDALCGWIAHTWLRPPDASPSAHVHRFMLGSLNNVKYRGVLRGLESLYTRHGVELTSVQASNSTKHHHHHHPIADIPVGFMETHRGAVQRVRSVRKAYPDAHGWASVEYGIFVSDMRTGCELYDFDDLDPATLSCTYAPVVSIQCKHGVQVSTSGQGVRVPCYLLGGNLTDTSEAPSSDCSPIEFYDRMAHGLLPSVDVIDAATRSCLASVLQQCTHCYDAHGDKKNLRHMRDGM